MTLNKMWINDALLDSILPPIDAKKAVMVVPMFAPSKIGIAPFNEIDAMPSALSA
jgi:hypothetical protein